MVPGDHFSATFSPPQGTAWTGALGNGYRSTQLLRGQVPQCVHGTPELHSQNIPDRSSSPSYGIPYLSPTDPFLPLHRKVKLYVGEAEHVFSA